MSADFNPNICYTAFTAISRGHIMEIVGQRLRTLFESVGLSQNKFAGMIGVREQSGTAPAYRNVPWPEASHE
jgi:hypothetical protein